MSAAREDDRLLYSFGIVSCTICMVVGLLVGMSVPHRPEAPVTYGFGLADDPDADRYTGSFDGSFDTGPQDHKPGGGNGT